MSRVPTTHTYRQGVWLGCQHNLFEKGKHFQTCCSDTKSNYFAVVSTRGGTLMGGGSTKYTFAVITQREDHISNVENIPVSDIRESHKNNWNLDVPSCDGAFCLFDAKNVEVFTDWHPDISTKQILERISAKISSVVFIFMTRKIFGSKPSPGRWIPMHMAKHQKPSWPNFWLTSHRTYLVHSVDNIFNQNRFTRELYRAKFTSVELAESSRAMFSPSLWRCATKKVRRALKSHISRSRQISPSCLARKTYMRSETQSR